MLVCFRFVITHHYFVYVDQRYFSIPLKKYLNELVTGIFNTGIHFTTKIYF